VRVATWNVRHARPVRGFASNRRLAAAVNAFDVDVLAVQEVERRVIRSWFADQPALIARAAGATARAYAPARRLALIGGDGVALCVRGSLFRHDVIELPHAPGQRRVALLALLSDITVVTTHLQNEAREAIRQLEWLLARLESVDGKCILMGDLNLRPADIQHMIDAAGFTLAGGGPTSPAHAPVHQIDHIAVRGLTTDRVTVGKAPVSDHRPLIAELSGFARAKSDTV
jgi:endonuclease/exonuclease/phosphatase family metal-dependent hydrolase